MEPAFVPAISLEWFGWTDRGRVRRNNEDSYIGLRFDAREAHHLGRLGQADTGHEDFVFAVSDGMGGANAGEFASRIAVDKIMRRLPSAYKQGAAGLEAGFGDVLTELFDDIHRALLFLGESDEDCRGMGATLSLCWFTPRWMYHAHIGDSRIYYLPAAGDLRRLTHDDTHVGWLYQQGRLNEREARNHPARNALQRALGAGHQFVTPHLGAVELQPGDAFVLCSDGLVDGLFDAQIEETLRQLPASGERNPARALVEAAVQNSGRDNTTAWVIEVG